MADHRQIHKQLREIRSQLTDIGYQMDEVIDDCSNDKERSRASYFMGEADDKLDLAWFAISDAIAAISQYSRC